MTITTSFMAFKQQLLLVMMLVCALQVTITSASLFKLNSPQPSDDAKIDKFRKFATKKRSILSISRNYDHDDIVSLEQCDSLIIRLETSLHYISQTRVSMIEYIKVILPETTKSDYEKNEIIVQHNAAQKQLAQPSSVLAQYLAAYLHSKPATVEGVKTFVKIKQKRKRTNEERRKLAKYIVPLGMYMFKYDKAIDYITRQYQKECLNYDGIVQLNKWYYITSWKNILNRINGEATQDWTVWEAFIATACPSPEPEEAQSDDPQTNNLQTPLDLANFDQEVSVPALVKPLLSYLPMIKDCSTNSDLINELVASFNRYKKMSTTDRKTHDWDLWFGYQKKLIVQQTIIRVMREKLGKTSEVEQSDEESDDDDEQISKRLWYRRAAHWAAKYKLKAFGVALAVGVPAFGAYLWLSDGASNLSTPFPNITLPPSLGVTDHRILSIEPVWLIVGVMIQLAQPSSVLSQYLAAYLHLNPATVEGIDSFIKIKQDIERTNEGRSELANYIVPLGEYMHKYDEAIDYITRQYQEHCLSSDGIVQQNKLYYLKVWWSSVKRINVEYSQDDMTQWEEFMATACPLPKEEFQLLNLAEKPLKLQNFDVPVPEKVKPLVPHLTMIKDCGKNFDLIHQLVVSFNLYRKMSPGDRSAHDSDLEIGYQKKLIVQQTIIRVMRKVPFKETTSKLHWFGRAVNWAEKTPWKTAGISYLLGFLTSRLLLSCGTPDPSTPFPNNTLSPSPGVTDRRILPIEPVWLIVGVMILVAIVLVGIGLCLICHRRNRLRKSSSDNGESDKTSKIVKSKTKKGRKDPIAKRSIRRSPVSSTRLLIGTSTSTKPSSSSSPVRSSLYTTSAFTPSDILGTIHRPSRTNTHGSSQPAKSPKKK